MAVISSNDRAVVASEYHTAISSERVPCSVVKADLRAAVDAIDQWISDNAASFNSAIPTAARNGLTTAEKVRLFKLVLTRRYLLGT